MRILLISIGTRGDMEPFLAIGVSLKERGHEVACCFPEQFRAISAGLGLPFLTLGPEFIELLDSKDGRTAMGGTGTGLSKFIALIRLALRSQAVNKQLIYRQRDAVKDFAPDRIVYSGKSIYPIIWDVNNPGDATLVSPVPFLHYVKGHSHMAFNRNFGETLNQFTYSLYRFGMVSTTRSSLKWLGKSKEIKNSQIRKQLNEGRVIYTISPTLFPPPADWPSNLQVLGYHSVPSAGGALPEHLEEFLSRHGKVLFVTFGSMTNPNPERVSRVLLQVLKKHKIPAIINTAAGGLLELDGHTSSNVMFVSEVDYSVLFPHIYAVMHHGGSGTTQLALIHGCATLIIPHILDQFVWDRLNCEIGTGPRGVSISKFTTKRLDRKIAELWTQERYKETAEQLSIRMKQEDFTQVLCDTITGN